MSIILEEKKYTLATEGIHQATITEIKELLDQPTKFGNKDKIRFAIEINDQDPDEGDDSGPVRVFTTFNKSGNRKAKLVEFLLGLKIAVGEGLDLLDLVGLKIKVMIVHNTNDGRTYANVVKATPAPQSKAAVAVLKPVVEEAEAEEI